MPQVTLYLDEETDALARRAAEAAGVSYSRWVSDLIKSRSSWPSSVRELVGSIPELPVDQMRVQLTEAIDQPRVGLGE